MGDTCNLCKILPRRPQRDNCLMCHTALCAAGVILSPFVAAMIGAGISYYIAMKMFEAWREK